MTKDKMIQTVKAQLALDYNCNVQDFGTKTTIISETNKLPGRRIYDSDGCFLKGMSFMGTAVFMADPLFVPFLQDKLANKRGDWLCDFSFMRMFDKKIGEYGHEIADLHQFYLPVLGSKIRQIPYEIKWFEQEDIEQFREDDRFDEAFAFDDNFPDVLAIAAMDGNKIAGMAAASADSQMMWQIGIDVFPEYRGHGIASYLVATLKEEVAKRGKVPFYSTMESHQISKMVGYQAGFYPAFAEFYTQPVKDEA